MWEWGDLLRKNEEMEGSGELERNEEGKEGRKERGGA